VDNKEKQPYTVFDFPVFTSDDIPNPGDLTFGRYENIVVDYSVDGEPMGGYIIPKVVYQNKPGIKAAIWRWLGRIFNHDDWEENGLECLHLADMYREILSK